MNGIIKFYSYCYPWLVWLGLQNPAMGGLADFEAYLWSLLKCCTRANLNNNYLFLQLIFSSKERSSFIRQNILKNSTSPSTTSYVQ